MMRKVITVAVLYVFMLSLVPSTLVTKTVEAATELKKVDLNIPYYVMDAVQYKEKTFLIGKEASEAKEKIGVSVKEGNNISVLIPDSEIRKTDVWGEYDLHVLGDTQNKLYISSGSYVFIVDKNTKRYQKQTEEEFLAPFMRELRKYGYTKEYYRELLFNKDGLAWVKVLKDSNQCLFVNKSGFSKVIVKQDGYPGVNIQGASIDKNSNLYYVDGFKNQLVMIGLNGKEVAYNIPTGFSGKPFIDQNNNIYMMNSRANNLGAFKIESGQLKLVQTLPIDSYDIKQDNNGQIWYTRDEDQKAVNYVFGYVDNQFNLNDVYATKLGNPDWINYDVDDKNIVVYARYTEKSFGTSVKSQPLKGWVQKSGKWYYYNPQTGKMQTGWLNDGGTWYYLNGNGVMQTGWLNDGGTWYYLSSNGAMKTGWLSDGGTWYYLNSNGTMKTGWLNDGGKWYYLSSGGSMQTGWKLIDGKWYYFYTSGQMAANTTIDGYKLGKDGALI